MAAATSIITEQSPFIVRTSFTAAQATVPLAEWAAKNGIKKVVTIVSDYGPGIDVEKAFTETFTKAGGTVENLRVPLRQPRLRALPAEGGGRQARRAPRLRAVGRRLAVHEAVSSSAASTRAASSFIAEGSVTDDDLLNAIGDVALGVDHLAPLLGGPRQPREQGLRRGLQEGQQRHAPELHGHGRL